MRWRVLACMGCLLIVVSAGAEAGWRAGVAVETITPEQPMWMSGYASRKHPAEGTLTDLWAKALVLEDASGQRCVAITLDLVGIDRKTSLEVRRQLGERLGFPLSRIALFTSHTHTGPVVGNNLRSMYVLDRAQQRLISEYSASLKEKIVACVERAVADIEPVRVQWGLGSAGFAVNRRNNREPDVPMLREQGALRGPVDHDVPVLAVDADGELKCVLFGYACHATVLSFYEWSGDYPGFAQIELEDSHPGCVAMFWAGCGADQNPLPRRKVELARDYGRQLATAVDQVLSDEMAEVAGSLQATYAEIPLEFAEIPMQETLEGWLASDNVYQVGRAKRLMHEIAEQGRILTEYPYPVQTWKLGNDVQWVILGGEVVVDFALRLKQEASGTPLWVAGYANDVMAYIPSERVLLEGGYEGGGAMLYYGLPSAWATGVEEKIVREAIRQAGQ